MEVRSTEIERDMKTAVKRPDRRGPVAPTGIRDEKNDNVGLRRVAKRIGDGDGSKGPRIESKKYCIN